MHIPCAWVEYMYRVGSSLTCNSITPAGVIAGGRNWKVGRQTVFFTAVDPRNEPQRDQPHDVRYPRVVPYRIKWTVSQSAVSWIDMKSALDRGLVFWQAKSNAISLNDSVPAECLRESSWNVKSHGCYDLNKEMLAHTGKRPSDAPSRARTPFRSTSNCASAWRTQHQSTERPVADQSG